MRGVPHPRDGHERGRGRGDDQEGEGVRQTEQRVRGAAEVVGDRVPRQEARKPRLRRGLLHLRTLDDVISEFVVVFTFT